MIQKRLSFMLVVAMFLFFYTYVSYAEKSIQTIRVAILDNPNMPPKLWSWLQYEKYYLRGVETAKNVSKKCGIEIVFKPFFYGAEPLDIMNEIPNVKAWHPDIILGPHYSNQFLMLKYYFNDVMILSSYASDKSILKLPSNFYSLSPPDEVTVKAMTNFIHEKFPKNNVVIINRVDCKACNDITSTFKQEYAKINPNISIKQNNFIGESDNLMDVKKIIKGYQKGDVIIIIAVNLYNYTDLIMKITPLLKDNHPTFISLVDNWGKTDAGLIIPNKLLPEFQAYLVNPLYFNPKSKTFRDFFDGYISLYGSYPNETVSYMTYTTLMSAISALNEFPNKNTSMNIKEKIIWSYRQALKNHPNRFRTTIYAVYQIDSQNWKIIDKMDMSASFK